MPIFRRSASAVVAVAFAAFSGAAHAAYSGLFVFGDSLSDAGNVGLAVAARTPATAIDSNGFIPSAAYEGSNQFSNGNVWSYEFAARLGLSALPALAGGTSFAFGGATTGPLDPLLAPPSLLNQVATFLSPPGPNAPPSALYVIAGGGNDARNALVEIGKKDPTDVAAITQIIADASTAFATNVMAMVDALQAEGAQRIIVWNTPNVGLAPAILSQGAGASGTGTFLSASMNGALGAALASETGVSIFDLFGLITAVNAKPTQFGLLNATDACIKGLCDTSKYLFWDGIHPTAAGHAIIADAMYAAAVPEPASYALMALGLLALAFASRRRRV
jgi:outer membrane lipase/esterase